MPKPRPDDLLFLLYDVARLIRVRTDQHARRVGMTRAQWVILTWLDRRPGVSQNELAALVEVEPITVARLVDRLETLGVVERRADPKDRRIRRLHLTAAAAPILEIVHRYKDDLDGVTTAGLTGGNKQIVLEALSRMKGNLVDEKNDTAEAC